ncbi:hypothetical protein [Janibacter alittae]|uniref:Uncharacterized protein n=1 Tax=Janibacter alittae TaxID=3115209 RepID=A0ABZ2MIG8_9MICO
MRLTTDDRVWRFQGRLVEVDGIEIPMHPRYVAVFIFLVAAPVLALLFSPLGWFLASVSGAVFGGIVAWVLADFVTGEVPVGAWLRIIRSEVEAQRRFRRDRLNHDAKVGDLR